MSKTGFELNIYICYVIGWIMLKGRQEEVDQSQILEYCVQRLQESLKSM